MFKKINIFLNGAYLCSTNQAKTCKEAKKRAEAWRGRCLIVAGRGAVKIKESDKITAYFDKRG